MKLNKYLLGMDIGGTKVRLALMNDKKEFIGGIHDYKFKQGSSAKDEVENNICLPICKLIKFYKLNQEDFIGLGLSLAALFDRNNGNITKWPNHHLWDSFPIKSYIEARLNITVIMEDDANSAALGEHLMGAGTGFDSFAYVTISTGIGCGFILNNSLYIGNKGWAGEIGHVDVVNEGLICGCGARGCLQAYVAGPALYKKYVELVSKSDKKPLVADSLELVGKLAEEGEETALSIFTYASEYLARVFYNMIMMMDIPLIVIGGGVSEVGDILLNPIRSELNLLLKASGREISVKRACLGNTSGVIGALNLVLQHSNN